MLVVTKDLKSMTSKILSAVDNSDLSLLTETLGIVAKRSTEFFTINVTNREYYVSVDIPCARNLEDFNATVNATLFLKLTGQITTDEVELLIKDNILIIKGNGTYKLPLIFEKGSLLELPEISIGNETVEMTFPTEYLTSMLNYNSKELKKVANINQPIQKLYYMDEEGAITFTASSACINSFKLPQPIRVLLTDKVVRLFKLFRSEDVKLTLGFDSAAAGSSTILTKIRFESTGIRLTAILPSDASMLNSVPVTNIRRMVAGEFPYSAEFSRDALLQAINRLMLFNIRSVRAISISGYTFEFNGGSVRIVDEEKDNVETVDYISASADLSNYTARLPAEDLKTTLESCDEPYLTIYFGNKRSVVITRGRIKNVVAELKQLR